MNRRGVRILLDAREGMRVFRTHRQRHHELRAATQAVAEGGGKEGKSFYEAKLATARFYAQRELPLSGGLRRKIEAGAESLMALPAEAF